jgi:predicted lipoprotein with Yx(FWY)xxD motif
MSALSLSFRIRRRGFATVALLVLVAGCSSAATTAPSAATPTTSASPTSVPAASAPAASVPAASVPAASAPAASGADVNLGTAGSGPILTGANGLTLYSHTGDSATVSTCTAGCATAWPPLTVTGGGQPTAANGVTGTLGTLTRDDGSIQVTYNGMPLYLWMKDTKPGDATGDGVNGFSIATP